MVEMSFAMTSFPREHFLGGRGLLFGWLLLFRDSNLAGCLAPAVPLKWAMAPPAGQLIISRCPPTSAFCFNLLLYFTVVLWADSQEDLVQLPPSSLALASGRCTPIFVPSGSPSYSHSHSHSGYASSCKLPASYDSQQGIQRQPPIFRFCGC